MLTHLPVKLSRTMCKQSHFTNYSIELHEDKVNQNRGAIIIAFVYKITFTPPLPKRSHLIYFTITCIHGLIEFCRQLELKYNYSFDIKCILSNSINDSSLLM